MVFGRKSAFLELAVFLFLLLSPGLSYLSVSKGVFGNTTVDFGEEVKVRISVLSDSPVRIERIEDLLPSEFSPLNLPPSCSHEEGRIICHFGYSATNMTIEYSAVVVGARQKVVFQPAMLYYNNAEGLPETKASNGIDGLYYLGRALLNVTVTLSEVDGEETLQPYLLPGSQFRLGVSVSNVGALEARNVSISISPVPGWNLTSGKSSSKIGTLSSGESQGVVANFKAPGLVNFSEGSVEINYTATWTDSFGKERAVEYPVLVFLSKADVFAKRNLAIKWRRTDSGTLESILETEIFLKNRGSAEAIVNIAQVVPGKVEKSTIVSALKLVGGEEKTLKATSIVSGERVNVSAGIVNYSDSRANSYPGYSFSQEELKIETSIWAKIYVLTDKYFPLAQIVALAIFVTGLFFLLPLAGKNLYLALALGGVLLLSALLLASTVVVWFGF